jgi:hypothetical protein
MKKNYFSILFAALMLFVAMPAKAQVTSVTEFFGKWQFTADVDVKNQDYANLVSNSCEVVITKGDNGYPAKMTNFAGSEEILNINSFNADAQTLLFLNPNTPQLWSPLYMADGDGKYPFGTAEGNWQDSYGQINFTYDAATGVLTYPDFTLVTADHNAGTTEIMVKVSNIKMTLLEAEEIVIPEIEGEWQFKPYSMGYVRNDSTFAYEFKINLVAKDDTKRLYDATFSIEGFNDFTLEATFDGVDLIMPFDNQYLDAEKKIRLGVKATTQEMTLIKEGQLSFSYAKSTLMWQGDYFVVRQDTIVKEEVDGEEVEKESAITLQQITYGWIEREDPNAYDWSGTYTVNVKDVESFNDTIDFPNTFNMVVEKAQGSFTVTEFAGYKSDYYPSIELIPGEDGKTATLDLAGYYGFVTLASLGEVTVDGETDYAYHILTDINGQSTSLTITLNEDGTVSIDDFSVSYQLYYANTRKVLGMMSGATASKAVFEWTGDYVLTAEKVDVYYQGEDVAFPETFDVTISYFDGSAYGMESMYYISSFLNKNIEQMPIDFSLAEDGWSAEMLVGGMCGSIVAGESYYKIYDMNGTDTPITVTANIDGSISIPGFFIKVLNYSTNEEQAGAFYQNVTLTRKVDSAVDNIEVEEKVVEGIFDIMGRKLDAITAPGLYIVNGKKVMVK